MKQINLTERFKSPAVKAADDSFIVVRGINAAINYLSTKNKTCDARPLDVLGSGDWVHMNGLMVRINKQQIPRVHHSLKMNLRIAKLLRCFF